MESILFRLQKIHLTIRCVIALILTASCVYSSDEKTNNQNVDSARKIQIETQAQRDARMAWWRDAKFGLFIHWGIYSIPADGEWHMRKQQKSFADYSKYAEQFNPVKFNANEWMSLAHEAGIKYLVFTTKHHDGFAMFKSAASGYNIVDATPFKRDVTKELSEACRQYDVRFCTYYSFLSDWAHKGGGAGCPHWDPSIQDGDIHDYVKTVALPQLKELMSNYGPISVMWFDRDSHFLPALTHDEVAEVEAVLKTQPQIIVNPRLPGVSGDFDTIEKYVRLPAPIEPWELCATINGSWGYTKREAKPINMLLPMLVNTWGMGGNVLLNVGPTPEGLIPEDSVRSLRDIGAWLKIYGESIYGTTAGPFPYLPWGAATRKGNTIYLQVMDWPADGRLKVPLLNQVSRASLLGLEKPVELQTSRESGRLIVQVPVKPPHAVVNVVALAVEGDPLPDYSSVLPVPTEKEIHKEGSLEVDAGKPVTVSTLRFATSKYRIEKIALEFQQDGQWKPIIKEFTKPAATGFDRSPAFVIHFTPVTAQVFRLRIIEAERSVTTIRRFELYPPF